MAFIKNRTKDPKEWTIYIEIGRGENNKREYYKDSQNKYPKFYGTETQAQKYADELESKIKKTIGPITPYKTLSDVIDFWLTAKRLKLTKSRSYESYKQRAEKLRKYVGDLRVYGLTVLDLDQRLSKMMDGEKAVKLARLKKQKKLTEKQVNSVRRTVKEYYNTMRSIIKYAIKKEVMTKNLMADIEIPEWEADPVWLSKEQLVKLLEISRREAELGRCKHYLKILLLCVTGMRVGELFALKWDNVSFERRSIVITKSADVKRRTLNKSTKSKNGKRENILSEETMLLLRAWRKQSLWIKNPDNLVFPSDCVCDYRGINHEGRPMRRNTLASALKRILKKAGLPDIRIHDIRHSVISSALWEGKPPARVAALVGDRLETILKTYAHFIKSEEAIEDILFAVEDKNADTKHKTLNNMELMVR